MRGESDLRRRAGGQRSSGTLPVGMSGDVNVALVVAQLARTEGGRSPGSLPWGGGGGGGGGWTLPPPLIGVFKDPSRGEKIKTLEALRVSVKVSLATSTLSVNSSKRSGSKRTNQQPLRVEKAEEEEGDAGWMLQCDISGKR